MDVTAILSALADSGANPAIRNIAKALSTVGAGSNLSALTGGGALRAENLDPVLAAVSVENKHFKFFNMLLPNKRDSFSMLDQAVVKKAIGGFPGSAVATETGVGQTERAGDYARLVTELGVFSTRRSVSLVTAFQGALQAQQGVVDFSAAEEEDVNAALEILVTLEDSLFYGDKAADSTQITGLFPAITAAGASSSNILDMAGTALGGHQPLTKLASMMSTAGKWAAPDELFCSARVKADLDNTLVSGYRVNLDAAVPSTEVGIPVRAMRYSSVGVADGLININSSAFISEDKVPVEVTYSGVTTLTAPTATIAKSAVTNPKFAAGHAGAYYYRVEEWAPGKVSPTGVTTAITVAAGDKVTLTIAQGSSTGTYYKIYRGRLGGTNAAADMRWIATIKKTAASMTFDDFNAVIPGTSEIALIENKPNVLRWLQMLPMTKVPFAMTDFNYPWGAILLGALRLTVPQKVGAVINILPSNKDWNPFA